MDALKKNVIDGSDPLATIQCHPCRTCEEQVHHTTLSKDVHMLNEEAKSNGTESYSLHNNGEVWKFNKTDT